jgi:hypothetical protein
MLELTTRIYRAYEILFTYVVREPLRKQVALAILVFLRASLRSGFVNIHRSVVFAEKVIRAVNLKRSLYRWGRRFE